MLGAGEAIKGKDRIICAHMCLKIPWTVTRHISMLVLRSVAKKNHV